MNSIHKALLAIDDQADNTSINYEHNPVLKKRGVTNALNLIDVCDTHGNKVSNERLEPRQKKPPNAKIEKAVDRVKRDHSNVTNPSKKQLSIAKLSIFKNTPIFRLFKNIDSIKKPTS